MEATLDPNRQDAPLCVLVVDNDVDTVECTAELLRFHGFRVITATSGLDALNAATGTQVDVLLSDLVMPGVDGYQVARHMRTMGPPRPVLIAVTGRATTSDRERAAEAGFDLHLIKPVPPGILVDLLNRLTRAMQSRPVFIAD